MLGAMLGQTLIQAEGKDFFDKIEAIRQMAKDARLDGAYDHHSLADFLSRLSNEEMLSVARAFSHFLNLANTAGSHHQISRQSDENQSPMQILSRFFDEMTTAGHSRENLMDCLETLCIEPVLTAHPTEIVRRTFIHKYNEIVALLSELELDARTQSEENIIWRRIDELITQMWRTRDFRKSRLTPVDEARWAFSIVENALWDAVPAFLRQLDTFCQREFDQPLPPAFAPVRFVSWMGGDRDGNPNVTAKITREVLLLSRLKSIELYTDTIQELFDDLAVADCSETLAQKTGFAHDPYRHSLRELIRLLQKGRQDLEAALANPSFSGPFALSSADQLWEPLFECYSSLCACGMEKIANSRLLDLLRRVQSFGIHLTRLDIRQESSRHARALQELTDYLGVGDYSQWDEAGKQAFLLAELQNPRPLIPADWQCSDETQEVLDTFREIARHPPTAFGLYIISMAREASDVLSVQLLMKECGCRQLLPVAPLFETLDDLNHAAQVMEALSGVGWYRRATGGKQTIMIGYSDSAKDAGALAASWAQYSAQERLIEVCRRQEIELTLFHGRGGTIGRGGAPAQVALFSQPPGSLQQGLRVTEQGETIRAKFGVQSLAVKNLAFYATAIVRANLEPPPAPLPEWRKVMDRVADSSCAAYRRVVRENKDFIRYFQTVTPIQELPVLPLGSRPVRRKKSSSIESLRAIPWIFAWSQNRLMLPAWLGAGEALKECLDAGGLETLRDMCQNWPFFSARLSLLQMVYAKSDRALSQYYDSVLLDSKEDSRLGQALRAQLAQDMDTVSEIGHSSQLTEDIETLKRSIELRNTYVDPLNVLQADLIRRYRALQEVGGEDEQIEQALMMTLVGVSAGLQNTG